jgi:hypothetical protein
LIVFLAGMQRSGSTFAFNVARDALKRRGTIHQQASADFRDVLAVAGPVDHILVKAHASDDLGIALARYGAMRVICTVRRPEDAVVSWMETFGFEETEAVEHVRSWLRLYAQIREVALTVRYETIDRHPTFAAWRIGRYLFSNFGWREARAIARRHSKRVVKARTDQLPRGASGIRDVGFSWYDERTFFHRRHVSSRTSRRAEERISAEQLARIRNALASTASQLAI